MTSTPKLPPATAFACVAGSWAASLAVAAYAGGPLLAASIAGWTALHVLATKTFRRVKGDFEIEGYPAWSFMESFLHGGVIMPTLFSLCLWLLPSERWDVTPFLAAPWDAGAFMAPLSQCHAAILAYMLKDFHLYDAIEVGYAVHHVVATFGCLTCLVMPMAAGLNTFNAVQSEVASAIFSSYTVWPSWFTRGTYYLTMTASNGLGGYLAYVLCTYHLPFSFRAIYGVAAFILVLLRQGAVVLDVQKMLAERRHSDRKRAGADASGSASASGKRAADAKASPPSELRRARSPATKARNAAHPLGLGLTPEHPQATAQLQSLAPAATPVRSSKFPPGFAHTPRGRERAAKSPARAARSPARAVAALNGTGLNGKAWGGSPTARRKAHAPTRFT